MKIILLKDISGVGRKYDIKNVADGFARNVLLPRQQAEIATEATVKRMEKLKTDDVDRKAAHAEELLAQLMRAQEVAFEIARKANDEGHLFAGLKKEDVLKVIHDKGFTFGEEHVQVEKPIKTTGKHDIEVIVGTKKGILTLDVKAA